MSLDFSIVKNDCTSIIELKGKILGDLDLSTISNEIAAHIENENAKILIDLTHLSHLNSTGINFFMKILTRCRIKNGDMILFGINANIDNLFKLTKLNEIYTIYSSKEEALNHF